MKLDIGNGKEVRVRFKGFPSRPLAVEDSGTGPRVRLQVLKVGGCCTVSVPADGATVEVSGQNSDAELRVSPLR